MGLIVPDLVHPFFSELAKGISSVLRTKGYGLVIASSEENPGLEKEEIGQMLARRLDVLLIASTQWSVESFRRIEEQQRRYILVDRKFSGLPANFVGTDDLAIGRMATQHLLENGCTRIAYIGGEHVSTAIERRKDIEVRWLGPVCPCRATIFYAGRITTIPGMQRDTKRRRNC